MLLRKSPTLQCHCLVSCTRRQGFSCATTLRRCVNSLQQPAGKPSTLCAVAKVLPRLLLRCTESVPPGARAASHRVMPHSAAAAQHLPSCSGVTYLDGSANGEPAGKRGSSPYRSGGLRDCRFDARSFWQKAGAAAFGSLHSLYSSINDAAWQRACCRTCIISPTLHGHIRPAGEALACAHLDTCILSAQLELSTRSEVE